MSERHFVKYTFLKVDPAWRRLEAEERAEHKREFLAACEDFADGHLLQSFSLVGTRGDTDLLLIAEAENLDRIHEFHVVLAQSGMMKWCETPYSFLGMRKASEYSEDVRYTPRAFRGKYVFVYPFVKSREWYALPAEQRWRIMQEHIAVGRQYPGVDNHTTYSFGLDDQEFVVAFDTDDVATFLDLVQRLRGTEASRYTVRDTPSFTCLATSLPRALGALDGERLPLEALPARRLTVPARSPAAHLDTPRAIAHLRRADPVLAGVIDRVGRLPAGRDGRPDRSDHYGALVRSIVGQQLSTKAARSIYTRLIARFDGRPPAPQEVLDDDPEELRAAAGLSRAKVGFLRSLAEHVLSGELELDRLNELSDEQVTAELTAVRGLGEWSAHMFLMFHLERPDVMASGDLGIRRAVQIEWELDALPPPAELIELAEPWRPHRTLACRYLWRALDNEPA